MGLNSAAVNLDLNSDFVTKPVSDFLSDLSPLDHTSKKVEKLEHCIHLLQDEMRKIQVFQRELPLSMLLLNDAITKLKEETVKLKGNSGEDGGLKKSIDSSDRKNWMSSVQLWSNNAPYENCDRFKKQDPLSPVDSMSNISNRTGGFVVPLSINGESGLDIEEKEFLPKLGVSISNPGVKMGSIDLNSEPEGTRTSLGLALMAEQNNNSESIMNKAHQQTQRKPRRCWSPELHRRFVNALQQLGGAQVATPKQIRELMQVEDLTNDEIKSHLQKYRLHVRKVTPLSAPISDIFWSGTNHYCAEVSKPNTAQSGSPEGPLQYLSGSSANKGLSISVEDPDEDMSSLKSITGN
ncbi:hypothetical protein LguiA_006154 [Lonicera macranthoides]